MVRFFPGLCAHCLEEREEGKKRKASFIAALLAQHKSLFLLAKF
jgi:hypothetical protein